LAIWWVLTRLPSKCILTAPSASTLEDGLFAEVKLWIGRLEPAVRQLLIVTSDRVVFAPAPERAFISVRTARADKPDALQGVHADYVLLIVDEASGVSDAVFEAAQGSLSGAARFMVQLGNPVYAQGYFYDSITTNKGTIWKVRNVSCHESKRSPQAYIDEMAALYGEQSNTYRVRVLGLPPKGDDDSIIPLHLVQSALDRDVFPTASTLPVWGLDVARLGANESALAMRQGNTISAPPTRFRDKNLMQLCGIVAATWESVKGTSQEPNEILVDGIGMGAGVVDRLRELGLPAVSINVSEHEATNPQHWNLKSELWWAYRAWLEARDCKQVQDAELVKALTCVKIKHHSTGKLMVESKDEMARRMKSKMPRMDAADAVILTFASRAATQLYGKKKLPKKGAMKRNLSGIV
jgi:hypothetical protein